MVELVGWLSLSKPTVETRWLVELRNPLDATGYAVSSLPGHSCTIGCGTRWNLRRPRPSTHDLGAQ